MNGKLNKNIGFSLLPLALFFLFEPFIAVLDVLPDFVGYVIICIAIIDLSDINDRIKDAFLGFRKAAIINFLRIPAIYLLKQFFIDSEQTVGLLIFTFVFSLLELLAIIPAYKNFFDAVLSLGITHGGTYVTFSKKIKRRTTTEKAYALTVWYLLIKYLVATLPEFTTLISNDVYEFVLLLRVFGIAVSTTLGVIWLIKTCKYFANVRRDTAFIKKLSEIYLNFSAENSGFYTARVIRSAFYVITVASLFSIDFYSEHINLIPDIAFYALILIAALILRRYSSKWIPSVAICSCGIATSLVSSILANNFYSEFYPRDVLKSAEAYDRFYTMLGLHITDSVVFLLAVSSLILLIWDIYKDHSDMIRESEAKAIKAQRSGFFKLTLLPVISAVLAAVATPYYIASQPFYYIGKWYFEYGAMISVTFSIIFAASMCYYLNAIISAVKSHYRILD